MSVINTYINTLNALRAAATEDELRRDSFYVKVRAAWKPVSEALCDLAFVTEAKERKVELHRAAIEGDWATKNLVAGLWGWGIETRAAEHFSRCVQDPFFSDFGGEDPQPTIDDITTTVRNLTGLDIKARVLYQSFPSGGRSPFLEFKLLGA